MTKIQILVSQEVSSFDAKVDVKSLKQIPTQDESGQTLTSLPSEQQVPIKVLQITPSIALKNNTKQATISFALTKEELGTTDPSQIILARFADSQWVELETSPGETKEDGSVEFSAITPGFSVFVVTTKAPAVEQEPEETPVEKPKATSKPLVTPTEDVTQEPTVQAPVLGNTVVLGAAIGIIVVLVILGLIFRKKIAHKK
ncbi:MAG TPA: PGF-pre-PGF domain-containing protein [archaeon]|nr:PGF-pre-PGF domain-containing protein [archaeon]